MGMRNSLLRHAAAVATLAPLLSTCASWAQDATPIYAIQGASHVSPKLGELITTSGIVTAVGFNFYYVQDPIGDADSHTSDGLFVFEPRAAEHPEPGDEVELTGEVQETVPGGTGSGNLSVTQLAFPDMVVLSTNNPLPDPTVIGRSGRSPPARQVIARGETEPAIDLRVPADAAVTPFNPEDDGIDFYESLEGMLVSVESPVAISAVRQFGTFSSEFFVLADDGRKARPRRALHGRGGIDLVADADGYGDLNPERVQIQLDGTLFGTNIPAVKVGDALGDITGVVGYSFGNFEVNAFAPLDIVSGDTVAQTTRLVGSRKTLTVASYNVLNLDPTEADDRQRAKLAEQITDNLHGPDIVALQEIQDNSGVLDDGTVAADETLAALTDAIVAAGGPAYRAFDVAPADGSSGGVPGGNIRNAFLYNPSRVALVQLRSLTANVLTELGAGNPNAFQGTRNPLLATFRFRQRVITVINNHLTSRFGSTPIFGGVQPFVQAGETAREAQAQALNDVVDALKEENRHARIVVLGDMNTFQFTDDLRNILTGRADRPVLFNMIRRAQTPYTFIFDGNSQTLDHLFVTRNLRPGTKLDVVHLNVDFPRRVGDVVASDHEPLLAAIRL